MKLIAQLGYVAWGILVTFSSSAIIRLGIPRLPTGLLVLAVIFFLVHLDQDHFLGEGNSILTNWSYTLSMFCLFLVGIFVH